MTRSERQAEGRLEHAKLLMGWGDGEHPCRICECRVSHKTSRGDFLCWWHWNEPIQLEFAQ